ncbi:MAG: hypothetical protein M0001_10205, partial [Treponema sp.]|nr:hypothetical protein [Treponema sp.]
MRAQSKPVTIWKSPEAKARVLGSYEPIVAAWPRLIETRRLSTRAGETFVIVSGHEKGPALVLLHGTGSKIG